MRFLLSIFMLLSSYYAWAGNAQVVPGREFKFPQDHNLHPEFQSEWWYITTTLTGEDGKDYGVQFTLFANTIQIDGKHQRIYFAHAALSSENEFYHGERFARANMKHAGISTKPWQAFIDHWSFTGTGSNSDSQPLPGLLSVQQPNFGYELKLSNADYFLQGDKGFSAKSADGKKASYYYNAPFIKASGTIRFKDKTIKVTGDAWLDREWSSGMFNAKLVENKNNSSSNASITDNIGWDWLALRLSKTERLMVYKVNYPKSTHLTGVIMNIDGSQIKLTNNQVYLQPTKYKTFAGKDYPIAWQLDIPSQNIKLNINPLNENQYLNNTIPYWEGAMSFTGSHQGKGYLELFY